MSGRWISGPVMTAALLTAGCGGAPPPSVSPASGPSVEATSAPAPPAATSVDATSAPPSTTPIGSLPAGAVTRPLVLHTSIEPLFGLTVTLLGRTHKELAGPPPRVVGVWDVEINRNKKTITTGLSGDELHLEGAGLGVSWTIGGDYDREQITVWPGETKPLGDDLAIALAEEAIAAKGPVPPGGRVTTTQGGTARIVFGKGKQRVWAMVGLHSRLVWLLGGDP